MKEVIHNKLVRDKIPTIIKRSGNECIFSKLSKENMKLELYRKLIEEMEELKIAAYYDFYDENNVLEELADVVTVALTMIGYSIEDLKEEYLYKGEKKGYFDKRIYLQKVFEKE